MSQVLNPKLGIYDLQQVEYANSEMVCKRPETRKSIQFDP